MSNIDSPKWDWFRGFCQVHPGGTLPCQLCIDRLHHSLVREATVVEMLDTWERGEAYTTPYTHAETKVAEKRWFAEGRVAKKAPSLLNQHVRRIDEIKVDSTLLDACVDAVGVWRQTLERRHGENPYVRNLMAELRLFGPTKSEDDSTNRLRDWAISLNRLDKESLAGWNEECHERLLAAGVDEEMLMLKKEYDEHLIRLYSEQSMVVDHLAGTSQLREMAIELLRITGIQMDLKTMEQAIVQNLLRIRKSGKLPKKYRH